jgi:hypothetical protein
MKRRTFITGLVATLFLASCDYMLPEEDVIYQEDMEENYWQTGSIITSEPETTIEYYKNLESWEDFIIYMRSNLRHSRNTDQLIRPIEFTSLFEEGIVKGCHETTNLMQHFAKIKGWEIPEEKIICGHSGLIIPEYGWAVHSDEIYGRKPPVEGFNHVQIEKCFVPLEEMVKVDSMNIDESEKYLKLYVMKQLFGEAKELDQVYSDETLYYTLIHNGIEDFVNEDLLGIDGRLTLEALQQDVYDCANSRMEELGLGSLPELRRYFSDIIN